MKESIVVTSLREIYALVAERVMGLVACQNPCHNEGHPRYIPGLGHAQPESSDQGGETRLYSSQIEDSWLVVNKLRDEGLSPVIHSESNGKWSVCVFRQSEYICDSGIAENEYLAICIAALRTRDIEVVQEIDNDGN